GLVGFEVIECAAGAPCPCAQGTPIFCLTRLALVAQADDATRQTRAVVSLNARRHDDGVSPTFLRNLLLPTRSACGSARKTSCSRRVRSGKRVGPTTAAKSTKAKFHHYRHR